MATKEILIKTLDCRCNECSHSWLTLDSTLPETCPACKSTDWNTIWQKSQLNKNTAPLSDEAKKRLESNIINQSRILQAMRKERRTIDLTDKPKELTE